jgi:class 3 adenylate cyclase
VPAADERGGAVVVSGAALVPAAAGEPDPDALRQVLGSPAQVAAAGDAVVAVFGGERTDPLEADRALARAVSALATAAGEGVDVRIALTTGRVLVLVVEGAAHF